MDNLQSILDKIRKLRALAGSSNEHEAAAAAAAADRLIQQHRIDEAQLQAHSPILVDHEPLDEFGGSVSHWRMRLITGLCNGHGCLSFTGRNSGSPGQRVYLVGKPSDMTLVRAMYGWLREEIERLSGRFTGRGSTWRNSYRLGCVQGCLEAMKTAADAVRSAALESGALVHLDGRVQEAEDALESLLGAKAKSRKAHAPRIDWEAFEQGEDDGQRAGQVKKLGR